MKVTSAARPVAAAMNPAVVAKAASGRAPALFDRSSFTSGARVAAASTPNLAPVTGWQGNRYSLVQKFMFPGNVDQASLLKKLDASMQQATLDAGLGTLHWSGGDLKMGLLTVVSLSAPHLTKSGDTMTYARDIQGGMLAGAPGGQLLFRCTQTPQGLLVEAGLVGFQPRLPKSIYLASQEPAHRAVVQAAVQGVLDALTRS